MLKQLLIAAATQAFVKTPDLKQSAVHMKQVVGYALITAILASASLICAAYAFNLWLVLEGVSELNAAIIITLLVVCCTLIAGALGRVAMREAKAAATPKRREGSLVDTALDSAQDIFQAFTTGFATRPEPAKPSTKDASFYNEKVSEDMYEEKAEWKEPSVTLVKHNHHKEN